MSFGHTINPFASHCIRPSAFSFQFPDGASVESLISQFRNNNYRGQIVGQHGSGKSTLLATLVPAIKACGIQVRTIALHDGQRRLPGNFWRFTSGPSRSLLIVDGYEQLSYYSRAKLRWHCWWRQGGLLVTTHTKMRGFPVLISLAPTCELMYDLLNHLVGGEDNAEVLEQAEMSFHRHAGNLREVWFDLYDRHERQHRDESACRVLPHSAR